MFNPQQMKTVKAGGFGGMNWAGASPFENTTASNHASNHVSNHASHADHVAYHTQNPLQGNFENNITEHGHKKMSSISIEDIILALQSARDEKLAAQRALESSREVREEQQKPLDLNRGKTFYIIAHKIFASGEVWQPDSKLFSEENMARYEMQRLAAMDKDITYRVQELHAVNWIKQVSQIEDDNENDDVDQDEYSFAINERYTMPTF